MVPLAIWLEAVSGADSTRDTKPRGVDSMTRRLKLLSSSAFQRALSLSRPWLSFVSAVTLRPLLPSKTWRAVASVRINAAAAVSSTPMRLSKVSAVSLERVSSERNKLSGCDDWSAAASGRGRA